MGDGENKSATGYVALLDVLGFSALISSDQAKLPAYLECLRIALDQSTVRPTINSVVFSDSIVLTTDDDFEQSLETILLRCSRLFGLLLNENIAIRGAVAHGSFFRSRSDKGVFIAGKAILDAYRFEQAQKIPVGIVLAPSVLKRNPAIFEQWKDLRSLAPVSPEAFSELMTRLPLVAFVQKHDTIQFHVESPMPKRQLCWICGGPDRGIQLSRYPW